MDIPKIGFGTWQLEHGDEAREAVRTALASGYRLIDTAKIYGNEASVGEAINSSTLKRSEIYVTTKLWLSDLGYESALDAFNASLKRLNLEYIDLYLIHWPGNNADSRRDSWKALEELVNTGKVKNIGVSNYKPDHLAELLSYCKIKPFVNQIEFHPFIYKKQKATIDFCLANDIKVEAYSPLAQANKLKDETLTAIANAHKKSVAQIMLAWAIAQKTIPIPRSSNKERIAQNFDVFDFKLSREDVERISALSDGRSVLG